MRIVSERVCEEMSCSILRRYIDFRLEGLRSSQKCRIAELCTEPIRVPAENPLTEFPVPTVSSFQFAYYIVSKLALDTNFPDLR
jgi:hypothetical protein